VIATSSKPSNTGHTAGAATDLDSPRLYEFLLPDCKPITVPSRRYSSEDAKFIRSEVQRLQDTGMVEPARSPWKVQVLAVPQGAKKRFVVDYSFIPLPCWMHTRLLALQTWLIEQREISTSVL